VTADLELAKDAGFMKEAAPLWDAPGSAPPYITIESTLLRAFEGYPKLTVPATAAKRKSAFTTSARMCRPPTWTMYARWKCST
jgi:hypothetical protein